MAALLLRPTQPCLLGPLPGLDFETKLIAKTNAAEVLEQQLSKPGYVCAPINLGSNTDPYQPIEREQQLTRRLLQVLLRYRHPVTIVTKEHWCCVTLTCWPSWPASAWRG